MRFMAKRAFLAFVSERKIRKTTVRRYQQPESGLDVRSRDTLPFMLSASHSLFELDSGVRRNDDDVA